MTKNNDFSRACAFTGHRPERLAFPEKDVTRWLEREIRRAVDAGYTTFISGMQRGVDLWAAEIVLDLRDKGENVRLVAASAFRGMEDRWDAADRNVYDCVLADADEVVFVSRTPGRAAFFARNHYMVDRASRLIAVYTGGGGGTLETIRYAEQKGLKVIKYKGKAK